MPTTTLTNAYATPLDEGIGSVSDGDERKNSAGFEAAIAGYEASADGAYTVPGTFQFQNPDATNDEVDITAGRAFVELSNAAVQSARGSGGSSTHDVTLGESIPVAIDLVSAFSNFGLENGTNDVHLALDPDGTTTGTDGGVYIQYGTAIAAPSDPSVYLGTVDTVTGTATRENDGPALSPVALHDVRYARAGELQAVIDQLAAEADVGEGDGSIPGTVRVRRGETLDPGGEIHVKPGVFVDAWDALFDPSSDYDGFFMDNNTGIRLRAHTDNTYTSDLITLQTSRATNSRYGPPQGRGGVAVTVRHKNSEDPTGATTGGRTLVLNDDAGNGIGNMPWIDVQSMFTGTGVYINVQNDSFVNTALLLSPLQANYYCIDIDGTASASGNVHCYGTLQASNPTQNVVNMSAGGIGPTFWGAAWDFGLTAGNAIEGAGPMLFHCANHNQVTPFQGTTNGNGVFAIGYGFPDSRYVYNSFNDYVYRTQLRNGWNWEYRPTAGGSWTDIAHLQPNGDLTLAGGLTENGSP